MSGFRYYATTSSQDAIRAMRAGKLGCIVTPYSAMVPHGVDWIADNGCYGKTYPGDLRWLNWLSRRPQRRLCRFAVAPDVVGDAQATLDRSRPHLGRIRRFDLPAALVAQDGLENLPVPWDTFDVLFLGGTTDWKLSEAAAALTAEAVARGKPVHMGRVNTLIRLKHAKRIGCSTVDGTHLSYGPAKRLPELLRWVADSDTW